MSKGYKEIGKEVVWSEDAVYILYKGRRRHLSRKSRWVVVDKED